MTKITIPGEFLKKVDRAGQAKGRSRSKSGRRSWKEALAALEGLEHQRVPDWRLFGPAG